MTRSSAKLRIRQTLLSAIIISASTVTAFAQPDQSDTLFISGHVDDLSSHDGDFRGSGGGGGVEWLHPVSGRVSLHLGVMSNSLADSRWTFGKVGANVTVNKKNFVSGEIDLGAGHEADSQFKYQDFRLGVSRALIDKRLLAEIEDQYVAISTVRGNLVKLGGTLSPIPRIGLHLYYHLSTSGNVSSNMISQRTDVTFKRVSLLGGFAIGRASPELFHVIQSTQIEQGRTDEYFAGFAIPMGTQQQMTVVFDTIRAPTLTKSTVLMSWRLPLRNGQKQH